MTALRNRLVTEQDGSTHISSLLLTTEEIPEALDWEVQLHEATGWTVDRYGVVLICRKGNTSRRIWVRSKPPLEDNLDP
jgi:hypothetical protein